MLKTKYKNNTMPHASYLSASFELNYSLMQISHVQNIPLV